MARKAVVIEYEYRAYSPPETPTEASLTDCAVTYNEGGLAQDLTGSLEQVRGQLDAQGYRLEGAQVVRRHKFGRWCPKWRETWARYTPEAAPAGSWGWSLEAQEARAEGARRARGYWPELARTSSKAIVRRPLRGGRRYQRQFADEMAHLLPGFAFNNKRDWWEADLAELQAAHAALGPKVCLTDGARECLAREVA